MKAFIRNRLKNQSGQGVMEYVIVSSLIGIVCITVVKGFGSKIKTRIQHMENAIQENID